MLALCEEQCAVFGVATPKTAAGLDRTSLGVLTRAPFLSVITPSLLKWPEWIPGIALSPALAPNDKQGNRKDMEKTIIGIDIAKAHFDIFDLNGHHHSQAPNSPHGIKALVKHFKELPSCQVIFEATGRYHKALEKALAKAGIAYTCVNPWQARRFAEATGKRAKTDKVDAKSLALMGRSLHLSPSIQHDEIFDILGEFELMRLALIDQRTAWKNREKILTTPAYQRILARQLKQIEKELKALTDNALKHIESHQELKERFDILCSIPGLGPTSALSILISMPELGTLNEKQVGALAGLAPMNRQSGTWTQKAHIRGGRSQLRKALFMPALVASRSNQDLKAFYTWLIKTGKPKMIAITAVMRKLIITANALVRDQRNWTQIKP